LDRKVLGIAVLELLEEPGGLLRWNIRALKPERSMSRPTICPGIQGTSGTFVVTRSKAAEGPEGLWPPLASAPRDEGVVLRVWQYASDVEAELPDPSG